MLHLIPRPLHRAGLRLAHGLRKMWWRMARPQLHGVNLLAVNDRGEVLLVRHTYGTGKWTLPGGGLKRGERPDLAMQREVAEELGCAAVGLAELGVNHRTLHGAPCASHIFSAKLVGEPDPDRREIAEVGFFPLDRLPHPRVALVDACVAMLDR